MRVTTLEDTRAALEERGAKVLRTTAFDLEEILFHLASAHCRNGKNHWVFSARSASRSADNAGL